MRRSIPWICVASIALANFFPSRSYLAHADLFGGDVAILVQILAKAIHQVKQLNSIIGTGRQTIGILEEMNRGVKEVLRLAETSHVPLPKQVFENAKEIDEAVKIAHRIYGAVPEESREKEKVQYRSGVEGLFLSQDAYEYSTFLDKTGERVKSSAVVASQASATRLTAETLGVLLHAVSHSNRIQAKSLEMASTRRVEEASQEAAKFHNFRKTHEVLNQSLSDRAFTPLNSFFGTKGEGQ